MRHRPAGPASVHLGQQPSRSAAVDVLLGAAAGAAGVWAMDRVGWFLYNREDPDAIARELQARRGEGGVEYSGAEKEALDRQPPSQPGGKDVAHAGVEKVAWITGIDVRTSQPNAAGIALHYALGVVPGALYGVIRRQLPVLQAGGGAFYGLCLFVLMDEVAAPALGLASGPRDYPWQAHARGAVAHVVLGVATEGLLRVVDRGR